MPDQPKKHQPRKPRPKKDDRPTSHERGYNYRWQLARADFLRHNPLCRECERAGKLIAALVVDHIIPHRGDDVLFWDETNWAPLCARCHNLKTARGE